ncbi:MAG: hypothetical protein AVDCRST_MAG61-722, partial [uncultured Friedmanniella sp.]
EQLVEELLPGRSRSGPQRGEVEGGGRALEAAQRLLERLGEVAADRHRLADRLHVGGEHRVGGRELLKGEPRDLHHDV